MNYIKYNRSFIMLEEQNNEFAAKGAPIKGHLKVETGNNKGAMRCAVSNLRYYEKGEYIYKLIFFGTKNERTIHTVIGTLLINRQGNGESYFRFQPLNIDGKGNEYYDYSAAIVAAVSTVNEKESLHPVLRGTIRSEAAPFKYEQKSISAAAIKEEQINGEQINEEMDKKIAAGQNTEQTQNKNASATEKSGAASPQADSATAEAELGIKQTSAASEQEHETYNQFYNKFVLNSCAHTCRMAEFYEDIEPFDQDKTGAVWKKIVNISSLPIVSPGAHYFATQYRHYIFGIKSDEQKNTTKFYFGIPGRFLNEEQPDGGESGFTFWQPIKGVLPPEAQNETNASKKNAYGYWIVEVDAKTGNITSL